MKLSRFGKKLTGPSGVPLLMDDLATAMAKGGRDSLLLGGGNPAYIPAMQKQLRQAMTHILDTPGAFEKMVGNYPAPQGDAEFLDALAILLKNQYGWDISAKNISLTNGSQSAFFSLFNLFAGDYPDGSHKKILLPMAPEYIGYADVGLTDDFFVSFRPEIEFLEPHLFKYHVDFNALAITDDVGAICVSRPTNPTGNVLTAEELDRLSDLAQEHNIPLMIDNAYGTPFPQIIYTDAEPIWNENIILSMSLSKLGMPAARTGIIIANEEITTAMSRLNAVTSLAPGSIGAQLALELVQSGEIISLSRDVIRPYYYNKSLQAMEQLQYELGDLDYFIHKPEGAFFLWLWFRDLPITSQELYERLKERKVFVIPGHYFFPGLENDDWRHKDECIRINYALDDKTVQPGLRIIADLVKEVYAQQ